MPATKSGKLESGSASFALSGDSRIVKILRQEAGSSESISEVSRVTYIGLGGPGSCSRFDFIESMLRKRSAEFAPSILVVQNGSGSRTIDNAVGVVLVKGSIEGVGWPELSSHGPAGAQT